jgi:hypothetical protein
MRPRALRRANAGGRAKNPLVRESADRRSNGDSLNYFDMPIPAASSSESRDSIGSATNSSFVHLSLVSDGLLTAQRR